MSDTIQTILDGGLEGSAVILLIVISYKIYRMKISQDAESKCSKCFKWKLHTENPGSSNHELNVL